LFSILKTTRKYLIATRTVYTRYLAPSTHKSGNSSKTGFSVNQEPLQLPKLEGTAIQRFKDGFDWLDTHMLNLKTTRLNLFCGRAGRPTDRFLAHLIISPKYLRGQKIITLHGINKSKKIIAKQWQSYMENDPTSFILGGFHCHAVASVDHDYVHDWKYDPPSRADTLTS